MISGLCNLIMSQGQTNKSTVQPKPNKLPKLSIQEEIENQEIVDRMNRKISFAKNQRHLGRTMLYADAF